MYTKEDFQEVLDEFLGRPGCAFVMANADLEEKRQVSKYVLAPFRPSKSTFFTKPVPVRRFLVNWMRYETSPWCTVFEEQGLGQGEYPAMVCMQRRTFNTFHPERMKARASKDFHEMKDMHQLENYESTERARGRSSAFRCSGSKQSQVVRTPESLYNAFDGLFHFDFDPCPVNPEFDAMTSRWGGRMCYVNPPFKHSGAFALRAVEQNREHGTKTVMICCAVVSSRWREELAFSGHLNGVIFLRDGICFEGYKDSVGMSMNLLLIGDKRQVNDVPCFFWDALGDTKKRRLKSEPRDPTRFLYDIGFL